MACSGAHAQQRRASWLTRQRKLYISLILNSLFYYRIMGRTLIVNYSMILISPPK